MQMAQEVIRERFMGRVIGTVNRAFVNGASAGEYSHPAKPLSDAKLMEAKSRASTELGNLMDAGFNFRKKDDGEYGHTHESATGGFSYFDVIFRVGDQFYQGVINLENNDRGTRLKDITQIKNITEGDYSSGGEMPRTVSHDDASEDASPNTSIPDSTSKSNPEFKTLNEMVEEKFGNTLRYSADDEWEAVDTSEREDAGGAGGGQRHGHQDPAADAETGAGGA